MYSAWKLSICLCRWTSLNSGERAYGCRYVDVVELVWTVEHVLVVVQGRLHNTCGCSSVSSVECGSRPVSSCSNLTRESCIYYVKPRQHYAVNQMPWKWLTCTMSQHALLLHLLNLLLTRACSDIIGYRTFSRGWCCNSGRCSAAVIWVAWAHPLWLARMSTQQKLGE